MVNGVTGSLVDVELLLVPDCPNGQPARDLLTSALRAVGLEGIPIRVSLIGSQRAAEARGFVGSPTILINGRDPFGEPDRSPALACRVYPGSGVLPSVEQLEVALTHVAFTRQAPERP